MPTIMIFGGLACGMLLAAVGLALWDSFRQVTGLSRAVQTIGWLAGALLLTGALVAWPEDRSFSTPALRLILMAALAAPPVPRRHHNSHWSDVMLILPALVLAGGGLFCSLESVKAEAGRLSVALVELALLVCGGLGARALGEALSEIASSTPHAERPAMGKVEWPSAATYALLTLLVGGTALVNLWQRGTMWSFVELSRDGGTGDEGGLAGAWLAWSAAWLGPRQHLRLRAVLTVVAALLLILLAAGY